MIKLIFYKPTFSEHKRTLKNKSLSTRLHNYKYFNKFQVNQNPVYQIYATIIAFYAPTLIMIILYAKMWLAAKRLTDQDRNFIKAMPNTANGKKPKKKQRPLNLLQKIRFVRIFILII